MRLQVPIYLAEEFYTLGKARRNEIIRTLRVIVSTKSPIDTYAEELNISGLSHELVDWLVKNATRLESNFDVYTDILAFSEDSEYNAARKFYEASKLELAPKIRHGGLGELFFAIHWLWLIGARLLPEPYKLAVLAAPAFSLLAIWHVSKAKGSGWKSLPFLFMVWVFAPVALIFVFNKLDRELKEIQESLIEPTRPKNYDLLVKIRELLRREDEQEDAERVEHNGGTSDLHPEEQITLALVERVVLPAEEATDLEKLFKLYSAGSISESEFKILRDRFAD